MQNRLRKAVVRWLQQGDAQPDAIALDVSTRMAGDRLDIASLRFRAKTTSDGARKRPLASRIESCGFICCATREECWVNCANADEITGGLVELRQERARLESEIRQQEPDLKDSNVLFEELATWDYSKSANPSYKNIQQNINWMESILYLGNKIQRIMAKPMLERYYIVVPEGIMSADELDDKLGLLWMGKDGQLSLLREPQPQATDDASTLLFLKRMLASGTKDAMAMLNRRARRAEKTK